MQITPERDCSAVAISDDPCGKKVSDTIVIVLNIHFADVILNNKKPGSEMIISLNIKCTAKHRKFCETRRQNVKSPAQYARLLIS